MTNEEGSSISAGAAVANNISSTTVQMMMMMSTEPIPSAINLFIINNIDHFERSLYILYVIIFILGVVGNSIVIYVLMSSIFLSRTAVAGGAGGGGYQRRATQASTTVANTTIVRHVGQSTPVMSRAAAHQNSFRHMVKSSSQRDSASASKHAIATATATNANNDNQSKKSPSPLGVLASTPAGVANYLSVDEDSPRKTSSYPHDSPAAYDHNSDRAKYPNMINLKQGILNRLSTFFRRLVKEKLTVTNFYLLNLAISDFLYSLFIPVLLITMTKGRWLFGSLFCKLYFSLVYLCQCSSVFILVVLSVDRYLSVKYPHKVSAFRTDEVARCVMLVSWFLSLIFITPVFLYTEIRTDLNNESDPAAANASRACLIHWPESWGFTNRTFFTDIINSYLSPLHAFSIYTFLLNYLIPVSIIVALYARILNRLNKRTQINNNKSKVSKAKKKSLKKINKMVLTIVICYIVCWTPYWCYQVFNYVYQHAFEYRQSEFLIIISHLVQIIAYMSSALNPFIYSYMSEAFRTSFRLVLESCNCCFASSTFSSFAPFNVENENMTTATVGLGGQELLPLNHNHNGFDEEISKQSIPDSFSEYNSSFKQKQTKQLVEEIREEEGGRCSTAIMNETSQPTHPADDSVKTNGVGRGDKSRSSSLSSSKKLRVNSSKLAFEINFHGLSNFKLLGGSNKRTSVEKV